MANFTIERFLKKKISAGIILLIFSSCASMQSPTGGPRDTISPKITNEEPKNLTRNFAFEKIEIEFDEFIKLTNEFSEISISPALDVLPEFKARKKVLEIKFPKPLEEKTTYTINFGKAITDVNESNILKNYTYVFATGDQIDSLSLSGTVTNALTKEKLKDVTVFILPTRLDSLFGKKRASFFTTTDSAGAFSLKNLREDTYRIYALAEQGGGDRIYNGQNEEIGFLKDSIVLNKNTENIRIEVFKAVPAIFSVAERKIESDGRIILTFNKPLLAPTVNIIDPLDLNGAKTAEISNTRDTALIWLPALTFDSIKVAVASGGIPLDTITLRRSKRDVYNRVILVTDNISGTKIKPKADLLLRLTTPIKSVQESQIKLMEDSVEVKFNIQKQTGNDRIFSLKYPWKIDKEYNLRVDENAFTDLYGNKSKLYVKRFSLDTEDNYGNISIKITVPDTLSSYIVQWMSDKETIYRQDILSKNTTLNYLTYPTAKYKVRIIYDENKNGIWDSGNVNTRQQPEKTWTFETVISLRPNWDLEEAIIIPKLNPE
ncbi:Ig-like domain-containing domain [Daejeonella sp.]|uniref:Ig-like domain-containing domain n=1 Tax=Daejeonella sp. TaxID=2805397 RepID=UPI0039838B0E